MKYLSKVVVLASGLALAACGSDDDAGPAPDAGNGNGDGNGNGNGDNGNGNGNGDNGNGDGDSGFDSDYAESADFFTLMAEVHSGDTPHSDVRIWYSSDLREDIESGDGFTAPVGATAIKEFDNDDGEGIVVMTKQDAGYDPDNGDWYYEMMDPDGNVMDSGAIQMCIDCHANASDTDYLAGTELSDVASGFDADYDAPNSDFFTQMSEPHSGATDHGDVQIWYSTDLQALIEGGDPFTAPVGATAIKEFDNADGEGVVVMTKQFPGYDPGNGDWYYEMMDSEENVTMSGAIQMCIGCHASASDTDYLGGTEITN